MLINSSMMSGVEESVNDVVPSVSTGAIGAEMCIERHS